MARLWGKRGWQTCLAAALLTSVSGVGAVRLLDVREVEEARHSLSNTFEVTDVAPGDDVLAAVPLELCECEVAKGSPNGLSCDKEGWFISDFQQAGQWVTAGSTNSLVPLSHAICCRPCLPKELPGATGNETALAVLSIGCHQSSGSGSSSLRCEATGGSFVVGWSEAARVPNNVNNYYYPVGGVDCCTPTLLLSTGEARELERCDCVQANDVNCGGQSTHRLLSGYERWGIAQLGVFVPITPAECCKTCISDTVIPTDSCYDLNYCWGHGVCNLGACECMDGYSGADCRRQDGMDPDGLPQWLISIIILASCATFSVLIIVIGKIVRYYQYRQAGGDEESEEGEQLLEPLIMGLSDDEGSVGSEDTTDYEEDEDDANMPPPISRNPPPPEAVGGGVPVTPRQASEQEAARTEPFEISHDGSNRQEDGEQAEGPTEQEILAAQIQQDDAVIEGIRRAEVARSEIASGSGENNSALRQAADDEPSKEDGDVEPPLVKEEQKDRGGLPGVECSVCLTRPVQVAVVPCGHMCLCRRCSRRLQTCPVCRRTILRRQRIFVGG